MSNLSSVLEMGPAPAYLFGEFRLEPDGSLLRADNSIHLPPKELAALRLFLENAGRVVTPSQLKQAVWGDVHVTADSILHCISSLRARLGSDDCILTIYKRGYRFMGPVRHAAAMSPHLSRLAIVPFDCAPGVLAEFGELIAEEATAALTSSAAPLVSMLARDSVFALARRGYTAQQIGESLHADLVLAGTLRPLPAHIRIRAELVRVYDGAQIWVEEMLAPREAGTPLHGQLAARIAARLGGELARPGFAPPLPALELILDGAGSLK